MVDKLELTKKFKLVDMYEADISTEELPIIGTQALATCVGVLVYSDHFKKAIVAHAATDVDIIVIKIMELIFEHGLERMPLKYLVIPGYYYNHYEVAEKLNQIFEDLRPLFIPFSFEELDEIITEKDPELPAYEFAFDAESGKFVSDKVLYGIDYIKIHENDHKLERK